MPFTVGSCFSGIGGIDLAYERVGATVAWNCEIDAKCRLVLQRHWPGKPRFKDVKTVTGQGLGAAGLRPDCLAGGFPCQGLSVAGKRGGLADERSALFFEFARLLEEAQPRWLLIENVPGLLSSAGGRDMGVLLSTLVNLGYGVAWRVLDAQYFGVAQRRRRVFIVGCAGDAARAREVLLVGEGGGGDPPARREARSLVAAGAGGCVAGDGDLVTGLTGSFGNGGADDNKAQAGWLVPAVSHALCAPSTGGAHNDHNGEMLTMGSCVMWKATGSSDDMAPAIGGVKPTAGYSTVAVGYRKATTSHGPDNEWERWEEAEHTNTLDAGSNVTRNAHAVVSQLAVRRLTPLECLRLQGFPDGWLDGLGLADSVKYRMAGNAVAVPVVTWIARRMLDA